MFVVGAVALRVLLPPGVLAVAAQPAEHQVLAGREGGAGQGAGQGGRQGEAHSGQHHKPDNNLEYLLLDWNSILWNIQSTNRHYPWRIKTMYKFKWTLDILNIDAW